MSIKKGRKAIIDDRYENRIYQKKINTQINYSLLMARESTNYFTSIFEKKLFFNLLQIKICNLQYITSHI